jgi:DNA sulfur modification protein DndE
VVFRLKTSKATQEILLELKEKTNITPNILARIAIALSLKNPTPLKDIEYDSSGLELPRHVLTGKYDAIFKALIVQYEGRELTDEEYFPKYVKLHLERGAKMLLNEYKYAGNYEKFILNLMNFNFSIIDML